METKQELTQKIPVKNTRAFNWCCTWNNPTMNCNEYFDFLKQLADISYFTFQEESGNLENTKHYQCYFEFNKSKYFSQLKDYLPIGTHIEQRRSTRKKARLYCQKLDTRTSTQFYEWGDFGNQGKRTDIHDIIDCIKDGMTDTEIMELYPVQYFHYQKNIENMRELTRYEQFSEIERHLSVNFIVGETGIGKTSFIVQKHGYKNVHVIDNYKNPFDRYKGQDVIVFEEFHGQIQITEMLRWLDIYPLGLPCRYNDKTACYTEVYLISNEPLEKLYPNVKIEKPKTWNALMRRIHNVYNFDDPNDIQKIKSGEPNPNPYYQRPLQNNEQINMRILTDQEKEKLPWN